jgi:hypothetical protein
MNLADLFRPFLNLMAKELSASIDEKQAAREILVVLNTRTDKEWGEAIDRIVVGGKILEAIDGPTGEAYIKKLRAWAEAKVKEA